VDADALARQAVAPGTAGLREVADAFGGAVLTPSGELDRAALRARVFQDEAARRRLEAIVHPEVARLRAQAEAEALGGHRRAGTPVVVHDIPLLFETGLEEEMDAVVLVDAPDAERLRRLVEIRGLDPDEARRMMAAQQPAAEKRLRTDRVIDNDGSLEELETEARHVWEWIRERAP
ncbi:MAG TPA: dephospho-CoA kinase, partial [Longimicrobiales bacterium]|nr:dephospho-CoA kinase [Longimicrobiales bacterium]